MNFNYINNKKKIAVFCSTIFLLAFIVYSGLIKAYLDREHEIPHHLFAQTKKTDIGITEDYLDTYDHIDSIKSLKKIFIRRNLFILWQKKVKGEKEDKNKMKSFFSPQKDLKIAENKIDLLLEEIQEDHNFTFGLNENKIVDFNKPEIKKTFSSQELAILQNALAQLHVAIDDYLLLVRDQKNEFFQEFSFLLFELKQIIYQYEPDNSRKDSIINPSKI